MSEVRFKVAPAWKGTYSASTTYDRADEVKDPDGTGNYRSLVGSNTGNALSDTTKWICIADLSELAEAVQDATDTNTAITNAEAARVTAENARDDAEDLRVAAENLRISNDARRTAYESIRQNNETGRRTAEEARVTAETNRVNAESARVTAENTRTSNETARESAEIERGNAETLRANAETDRGNAETERENQETIRKNAETARAAAEVIRENSEGSSTDVASSTGSRWARYKYAEAARTTDFEGDMNTWAASYTAAEATRETQYSNAEGSSTDTADANGSRWARYNYAEQSRNSTITDHEERLDFLEEGLGKYSSSSSTTLTQAESDKYVNTSGTITTASGYGISESITLKAGDILLVPSADAVPASVSVVSRIVTRTYDKIINYTYTYRTDYPSLVATAAADYDNTLVYTAVYDETTETPTLTSWTIGGTTLTELPSTYEVTESYYAPLVKQSVSAMPSTGYYVYLCPVGMTVVISGYTATVSGGVCYVVGLGIFKNICSNFVGAPGQAVIAQAFAQIEAEIEGLKDSVENPSTINAYTYCTFGAPNILYSSTAGAPSASIVPNNWDEKTMGVWTGVPRFIGQEYIDQVTPNFYKAKTVTGSVSDWVLL